MEEIRVRDFDESESFWKIDGPICRKDYIKSMFLLYLLLVLPAVLLYMFFGAFLLGLILILLLCGSWILIAIMSKRLWDITGSKVWGIVLAILIWISQSLPIVGIPAVIVMACIPGTCLKVSKK